MKYLNNNIRADLQEAKQRLYSSTFDNFGNQIKYFFDFIKSNRAIMGIVTNISAQYPFLATEFDTVCDSLTMGNNLRFEKDVHHAAFCFQFFDLFITNYETDSILSYDIFIRRNGEDTKENIIENFISPFVNVIYDKLAKPNSILYLLEMYKRRTEWFTRKRLFEAYDKADKNYENLLDEDLRLFLFDQGIEFPFSTPLSPSGRGDIVGQIETEDPLIIEIKIFDTKKGYGKERIFGGLSQIVKYTNDYNKNVGYLVIYNMDFDIDITIKTNEDNRFFPPSILINNKTYYFIIINSAIRDSASKAGKLKEVIVTEQDLKEGV